MDGDELCGVCPCATGDGLLRWCSKSGKQAFWRLDGRLCSDFEFPCELGSADQGVGGDLGGVLGEVVGTCSESSGVTPNAGVQSDQVGIEPLDLVLARRVGAVGVGVRRARSSSRWATASACSSLRSFGPAVSMASMRLRSARSRSRGQPW